MRLWHLQLLIVVVVIAACLGARLLAGSIKPAPRNMAAECGSDAIAQKICAEFR